VARVGGAEQGSVLPVRPRPGHRGLSDFTAIAELRITVAGAPFAHILYHFVLAFSPWEHVNVVEGGESFAALPTSAATMMWAVSSTAVWAL